MGVYSNLSNIQYPISNIQYVALGLTLLKSILWRVLVK